MRERKTNIPLLKRLISEAGGYKKASEKTGKSVALLSGLANGTYKREIKEKTRVEISDRFGVTEDELFTVVGATEDKAS